MIDHDLCLARRVSKTALLLGKSWKWVPILEYTTGAYDSHRFEAKQENTPAPRIFRWGPRLCRHSTCTVVEIQDNFGEFRRQRLTKMGI